MRDIRQSKNQPELEKSLGGLNTAFTAVTGELDVAIGNVANPGDKEHLQKIRSLAVEYHNHASEIGKSQLKIFEITRSGTNAPPTGPRHLRTFCCRRR